jgi:hypothetical protein
MKADWKVVFPFVGKIQVWGTKMKPTTDFGPIRFTLAAIGIGWLGFLLAGAQLWPSTPKSAVTAIDILLDPDATMMQHAQAGNERLRKSFPGGYALDESHQPHVTCLQRYVKTADLERIYAAVGRILATEEPASWKLRAYKFYYIPAGDIGLAGIVIEPTADLIRFQQKLIDAVAPFTVPSGTAAAFVTTAEDPDINQPTIDYVAKFVPEGTGEKFNPHVTIGIARQDYLNRMLAEKFETFTFSPVAVAVYQLGNFCTARTKLKSW